MGIKYLRVLLPGNLSLKMLVLFFNPKGKLFLNESNRICRW